MRNVVALSALGIASMMMFSASCTDYQDFSVLESDCARVQISDGSSSITIAKDTAWYVAGHDGSYIYSCDPAKVSALFNIMRDLQVMGLSSHGVDDGFDRQVYFYTQRGSLIKEVRLQAVAGNASMIGSRDHGECFVVGVPGLDINPIVSISPMVEYWKDLSLLEFKAVDVAGISVRNFVDQGQSFSISTAGNGFQLCDSAGNVVDCQQDKIRKWLGAVEGKYQAFQYLDPSTQVPESDLIYTVKMRNRLGIEDSVAFFKKYMPDGSPDFNQMYFRKNGELGTARYFYYDRLLTDISRILR